MSSSSFHQILSNWRIYNLYTGNSSCEDASYLTKYVLSTMGVSKESISKFLVHKESFTGKICWLITCLHPSWKVHIWIEICARLNHRKKKKADGGRLIPRKHTETLVLLSVTWPIEIASTFWASSILESSCWGKTSKKTSRWITARNSCCTEGTFYAGSGFSLIWLRKAGYLCLPSVNSNHYVREHGSYLPTGLRKQEFLCLWKTVSLLFSLLFVPYTNLFQYVTRLTMI